MDMTKFSKENDRIQYVLLVFHIFSKYLWLWPLKDKMEETTTLAFRDVLRQERKPSRIRADKGQELRSKVVNDLLTDRNRKHVYSQNTEVKANYADRAMKTMKTKIYRYMTFKQSKRYIDRLQEFPRSYNKTYHRTIDTKFKQRGRGTRIYVPVPTESSSHRNKETIQVQSG